MTRDNAHGGDVDLLAEIDALPEEERASIKTRAEELDREVRALKELRKHADKSQKDVAQTLGIKQPSVSKIEAQADMYLSTLRDYIEALGGSLKLVVDLPDHGTIQLDDLADLSDRQRGDVDPQPDPQPQRQHVKFFRGSRLKSATDTLVEYETQPKKKRGAARRKHTGTTPARKRLSDP